MIVKSDPLVILDYSKYFVAGYLISLFCYEKSPNKQFYNCGEFGYFIRDCTNPRNIFNNIGVMLRTGPDREMRILSEVCLKAEENFFPEEENDVDLFFPH